MLCQSLRSLVQGDEACEGGLAGTGLVESNMTGPPKPQQLQVDAACRPDGRLVLLAEPVGGRRGGEISIFNY